MGDLHGDNETKQPVQEPGTNNITGKKFEEIFHAEEMKNEKRVVSHATNDPSIDKVLGKDGKTYSLFDAFEKKIDWIQIDVGFISENEKETTLKSCNYAVINGSHTVMGEIIGIKGKPIIGIPVYDEQTNQIQWAQEHKLGINAKSKKHAVRAILELRKDQDKFKESIQKFRENFVPNGAQTAAKIAVQMLEDKR